MSSSSSSSSTTTTTTTTMENIQERVLKYKFYIIFTLIITLTLVSLIFLAPSFITILAYFWPLLLSTALFLVAVVFFGNTSSLPATDHSSSEKAAEGLLDYVAGEPEEPVEDSFQD